MSAGTGPAGPVPGAQRAGARGTGGRRRVCSRRTGCVSCASAAQRAHTGPGWVSAAQVSQGTRVSSDAGVRPDSGRRDPATRDRRRRVAWDGWDDSSAIRHLARGSGTQRGRRRTTAVATGRGGGVAAGPEQGCGALTVTSRGRWPPRVAATAAPWGRRRSRRTTCHANAAHRSPGRRHPARASVSTWRRPLPAEAAGGRHLVRHHGGGRTPAAPSQGCGGAAGRAGCGSDGAERPPAGVECAVGLHEPDDRADHDGGTREDPEPGDATHRLGPAHARVEGADLAADDERRRDARGDRGDQAQPAAETLAGVPPQLLVHGVGPGEAVDPERHDAQQDGHAGAAHAADRAGVREVRAGRHGRHRPAAVGGERRRLTAGSCATGSLAVRALSVRGRRGSAAGLVDGRARVLRGGRGPPLGGARRRLRRRQEARQPRSAAGGGRVRHGPSGHAPSRASRPSRGRVRPRARRAAGRGRAPAPSPAFPAPRRGRTRPRGRPPGSAAPGPTAAATRAGRCR